MQASRNATENGAYSRKEDGVYTLVERLSRYAHTRLVAYTEATLYAVGKVRKASAGVPTASKGL